VRPPDIGLSLSEAHGGASLGALEHSGRKRRISTKLTKEWRYTMADLQQLEDSIV